MLIVLALAAAARGWQATESLWVDELHTAWVISGPFHEVAQRAGQGNQSPLFFAAIYPLPRLCGWHEVTLRAVSLVSGVGLVVAVALVTRRWTGSAWAGVAAAALAATDPRLMYYSLEVRPYALLILLTLCHAFLAIDPAASRKGAARRRGLVASAAFVLLGATLFWLHYTAALYLVAVFLFALGMGTLGPARLRTVYRQWVVALVLTAALTLPAVPHVAAIAARRRLWQAFIPQRDFGFAVWGGLAPLDWCLLVPLLLVLLAVGGFAIRRFFGQRRRRNQGANGRLGPIWRRVARRFRNRRFVWTGITVWYVVPVLSAWLATTLDFAPLFYPRYLLTVAPAPLLAGGLLMGLPPLAWQRGAVAVVLVVAAIAFRLPSPSLDAAGLTWRPVVRSNERWRQAIAAAPSDRPAFVQAGLIETDEFANARLAADPYASYPVRTKLYAFPPERIAAALPTRGDYGAAISPKALHWVRESGGAVLITRVRGQGARVAAARLADALRKRGAVVNVTQVRRFGGVTVVDLGAAPR